MEKLEKKGKPFLVIKEYNVLIEGRNCIGILLKEYLNATVKLFISINFEPLKPD